ncbi:3-oxoacyl-ACP reductase family protein [Holzapfeliella sp. He02]|uniref:3-oxoacyl-ACP reductase family protein n=1 Tax=Holzapfeliella saturejae TaxID=3082953 RepID=A0ABU8SHP3_9LACO
MSTEKKVALVTGGAKGIGLATAKRLSQDFKVVINIHSDPTPEQLKIFDDYNLTYVKGDVASEADSKQIISDIVDEYGHLDVLVNNAGITRDKLMTRMKQADFEDVINTNLTGTFNMSKFALKQMQRQRSGNIINLSSIVGLNGNIGQANYAASKAGIIGLTKTIAREGALRGVRCNAVAPGMIETSMTDALSDKTMDYYKETIPLKRFGTADEVAQTVEFLIQNPYITGQVIAVDGGLTI